MEIVKPTQKEKYETYRKKSPEENGVVAENLR